MSTNEMLSFCGGVLGPALVARDVAETLRHVPELNAAKPVSASPRGHAADQLLRQVFPGGLEL